MKTFPIILILIGLFACGCSEEPQESTTDTITPAPSSTVALQRALDALARRDADAISSLVSGDPKVRTFYVSVVDGFKAIDAFREKFVAAYGRQAWDEFQKPLDQDQQRPDMNLVIPDIEQMQLDYADWKANDENKGVFDAFPGLPMPFKQVDNGWVIDASRVFPDEKTLIGYTNTSQVLAEFLEKYAKAIGHEGISAEDLDYQMGKDFMTMLMGKEIKSIGETQFPDRFDINEI